MKKVITRMTGCLLIIVGIGMYLYPDVQEWMCSWQTKQYIEDFRAKYNIDSDGHFVDGTADGMNGEQVVSQEDETETLVKAHQLEGIYQEMLEYNTAIYENGQIDLKDAWSYTQTPVKLTGLEDGKFGYIRIPSMDLILPLYIGASDANMAKGAAVMGQTSIPIGGENTNSVIVGHRGWSTGSFFLEIESVSVGDYVYITTPWDTLAYQAESIDIIEPYDTEAVMIQKGRDMVTLVTCHPYMSHGQYRYIVYCIRDMEEEAALSRIKMSNAEKTDVINRDNSNLPGGSSYIVASDGTVYESSKNSIQAENRLRRVSALAIMVFVLLSFVYSIYKREGK